MSQIELQLHDVALVDDAMVASQPTLTRALVVCADMKGMEDKEAAAAAGLDPATWSKVKSAQAHFPHLRFRNYQQRCGNWLPLQWLARDAGFSLVRLETTLERHLRETQEKLAESERTNAVLMKALQGR